MLIRPKQTEPFHYVGGRTGCLLIHGFTGSPAEMAFLGEKLAHAGFTVIGLRLPGHGTTVEDMVKTFWEDWRESVHKEVAKLRMACQKVMAIGLSMGGLLALDLGVDGLVDGVVVMNAPMILQSRKVRFAPLHSLFKKFAAKPKPKIKTRSKSVLESKSLLETKPGMEKQTNGIEEGFWYDRVPVKSLISLKRAIPRVRRKLSQIKCPVLLMQSTQDKTVNPKSVKVIERNFSITPEVMYWEKSGHILTLGPEREEVAKAVARFVLRLHNL